jgi:hypothetical protein
LKGSKKRIGPNKWRLVLDLERGLDGKRKQHRTHFTGTDRQAEVELRRLLTAVSDGSLVYSGLLNVADLMTRWLDSEQRSVSWTLRARGMIQKNIHSEICFASVVAIFCHSMTRGCLPRFFGSHFCPSLQEQVPSLNVWTGNT